MQHGTERDMTESKSSCKVLAPKIGVHVNTLYAWGKEGCPVDSLKSIEAWRKVNKPGSYEWSAARKGQTTLDMQALKKMKLKKDIEHLELAKKLRQIEIDKESGKLISAEESAADIRAITEEVKSTLQFKMVDQLPVLLEGKSIAEIRPILEQSFTEILGRWQAFGRRHGVKA